MGLLGRNPEAGVPDIGAMEQLKNEYENIGDQLARSIESVGLRRMKLEDEGMSKADIYETLIDDRQRMAEALEAAETWEAKF